MLLSLCHRLIIVTKSKTVSLVELMICVPSIYINEYIWCTWHSALHYAFEMMIPLKPQKAQVIVVY